MSNIGLTDNFLLPGPTKTIAKLYSLLTTGILWPDILATVARVGVAFIISILIGLPAGILLGSSKKIYRSVEFLVDFREKCRALERKIGTAWTKNPS